ncbi:hypothetical protein Mal15_49760 [Stieleria maiorica]|uniref:Uncharacterized protein n=1 Tax=Stieleria maiorica TaxID=2795974 RepID=A0A5B9MKB4_9BACT|nr:DUF6702 family protein [Stieleria maiorica]QEG00900.1 hypothetical protein Mal15_49760 [Stieleria maiorica]
MIQTLWIAAALLMHPVHETVCEIEWNAETKRVEVALRIDVLDEQWMARSIGADSDDQWRGNYLRSRVFFDPISDNSVSDNGDMPDPSGRPIKWLGRKPDGGHAWWFFEVVCEDGVPPTSILSRLLFDRDRNYRHHIVVLGRPAGDDGKRVSIVLTEQKPSARLELVVAE